MYVDSVYIIDYVFLVTAKLFTAPGRKVERPQTFEELNKKLEELKGIKRLDYKQKLLKKNLKNRIKKKTRKEERMLQKKLVNMEKNGYDSSNIKTENGEVLKIPKPKPVFNSQGKMVFSKFDFSEIGVQKKLPKGENNPKKILQQLQEKKEKLKQLEESGDREKVEEIKEKDAWKAALAKASGEKVCLDLNIAAVLLKELFFLCHIYQNILIPFLYFISFINLLSYNFIHWLIVLNKS